MYGGGSQIEQKYLIIKLSAPLLKKNEPISYPRSCHEIKISYNINVKGKMVNKKN